MRHLGSALLLGVLLAIVLVLISWGWTPQLGEMSGKTRFTRTFTQLDLIEGQPAH